MQVIDHTGKFSQVDLNELVHFVNNELLSNIETQWLVIRIRDDGRTDYYGYWTAQFIFDDQNQINGISAIIVLNYFYLKTIDTLKETLAHEYGHHWTLSYLAVNQGINYTNQHLPRKYYQFRGLNKRDYAHDYSKGWEKCDKEIIAEDYRVLFAPHPYNQNHEIVVNSDGKLKTPNQQIKEYIKNLKEDNKSGAVGFFLRKIVQKFAGDR